MRACWIDHGNDPRGDLGQRFGITEVVFDIRDPRLTPAYLDHVRNSMGYLPLLHADWNWPETENLDGHGFAEWTDAQLKRIGWLGNPGVHLNDETHDCLRISALLRRWRELRPRRRTLWTMEAHQSDFFLPIRDAIKQSGVDVGPQCYVRDMERVESAYEVQAWSRIVPLVRIFPFLDAAQLGHWWDNAVAYTQGRLPQ